MRERVQNLKDNIASLMLLLEEIQSHGVQTVAVKIDDDNERAYSVGGIHDALGRLSDEVTLTTANSLHLLQARFEHDRTDVYRIVGRLSQVASSWAGSENI